MGLAVVAMGLVHCTSVNGGSSVAYDELVEEEEGDAGGDAGDAGRRDGGDGGDAAVDAGDADAGDADAATDSGAVPEEEEEPAPAPPKKPKPKPVQPADDEDEDDGPSLAAFPDPSSVRLGALPDGEGGCALGGHPGQIGAPLGAMIALTSLVRRRRRP